MTGSDQAKAIASKIVRESAIRTVGNVTRVASQTITTPADLGECVRKARKASGLTQQEFADLAGVGRRFVIDLEKGKPSIELGRALKVAQAIGITLSTSRYE